MGLFVQRPEEPSQWAGLPGEPVRPRTRAEVLPDDDEPAATPTALLGLADARVTSISIPLDDELASAGASAVSAADSRAASEDPTPTNDTARAPGGEGRAG